MSELKFRNLDSSPDDAVESWPHEGLVTAIERGLISDWRRIAAAIRDAPWGSVARGVEEYAGYGEEQAVSEMLMETVRRARSTSEERERIEVTARVQSAILKAGMPAARFASEIGTSASRLSTYRSGTVQPSAAMLMRIESAGQRLGPR